MQLYLKKSKNTSCATTVELFLGPALHRFACSGVVCSSCGLMTTRCEAFCVIYPLRCLILVFIRDGACGGGGGGVGASWNYLILLLVHGQVNGQNPLAQPNLLTRRFDIFFLYLKENIHCGYSLEAPNRGASNEYKQHMFSLRHKKIYLIIRILFLAGSLKSLSQNKEIEIPYLSSGKWDKLDKSGTVLLARSMKSLSQNK